MPFCPNCQSPVNEDHKFCQSCGASLRENKQSGSRTLHIGQLVWSIINLLLCCCAPFGIVSLIFVLMAKGAQGEALEKSHLHKALIFNIIGTVFFTLYILCVAVLSMLGV